MQNIDMYHLYLARYFVSVCLFVCECVFVCLYVWIDTKVNVLPYFSWVVGSKYAFFYKVFFVLIISFWRKSFTFW